MNQIAGLLSAANILLDLDAGNKKRVFEQVGLLFENNHGIGRTVVYDSLFTREKLGSTGLGQGVAIPHGRIKGLPEAIGAFVRTQTPIPFDSPDGRGVALIFVLLVPEHATDRHLQILSELAQMFSDKPLRDRLLSVPDADALRRTIVDWQPDS
ncbi:MAG: PTS IIA-like nitrogen regulatory protein PtsN [Betaproteobacteria bacterium]